MKQLLCLLATFCFTACNGDDHPAAAVMLGVPYPDSIHAGDRILTARVIARGDSIFHGLRRHGTCFTCHGNNLRGGPITPDLTDGEWHQTDGSWPGIRELIRAGVPDYDPPMPPAGGAMLTGEDIDAVAAYVYWRAYRHVPEPARQAAPADAADHDH